MTTIHLCVLVMLFSNTVMHQEKSISLDDYVVVPMTRVSSLGGGKSFVIQCSIEGRAFTVELDTGSAVSMIDFNRVGLDLIEKTEGAVKQNGSTIANNGTCVDIRGFQIGNFETRKVSNSIQVVDFDLKKVNETRHERGMLPIDGIIADDFLNLFDSIIDYKNHKLYLKTPISQHRVLFDGKWNLIRQTENGQSREFLNQKHFVIIDHGKIHINLPEHTIREMNFHVHKSNPNKFVVGLFNSKEELDSKFIYEHGSIVEFEGDKMKLCVDYNIRKTKATPEKFEAPKGSPLVLYEFERVKK
jgi:uncharacterized protein (TIGR03067 family)